MTPDLVILNARIRSMDPARPRAEAIAIAAGRILCLGTSAEIGALAGHGTRILDAGGRLVLPGFQDAHVHLLDGGTDLIASADLSAATRVAEVQRLLRDHAARVAHPLVVGSGWQAGSFGDHNLTRGVLDAVLPDRPCILYDSSGHTACLNSAACAFAGIGRGTPDPQNGHIVVDASGTPTGMLHEDAILWAVARLPPIAATLHLDGLRAGMAHAARHGITGIIDPHVKDTHVAAYGALDRAGALTLRVSGAASVSREDTGASAVARLTALREDHCGADFRVNAAKFFLDGVLENRTASMISPYGDAAGGTAPLMYPPARIAEMFAALDAARFQIHVHAIGDMATRAALDGFEAAMRANGRWPSLHQIAHLQVVDRTDIPRIARLGVMANIQPLWARYDPVVPDDWLDLIGPARMSQVYAFRQMIDAGADWCLSSDWSVSTLNPFEIIETAVTRRSRRGTARKAAFLAAECLTVPEAVLGYTAQAAAACWRADCTGRLRAGYSADLIVLDRDFSQVPSDEISETQVLMTVFKGETVWRSEVFDG